jgi:inosine-uridine nucleoside N-ribohydrolase
MRLILDCDPGIGVPASDIDDGLAIGMALRAPGVELELVSVVAGNKRVSDGVACALAVIEKAGAGSSIPVYAGADEPLLAEADAARWRALLDEGRDTDEVRQLWEGIGRPSPHIEARPGFAPTAIAECILAHPGEVSVVAVGPLTNVAIALLQDPRVAGAMDQLVIVGGVIGLPGGEPELNFGYDPEAAEIVLRRAQRITLVPVDVSWTTRFTTGDCEALRGIGSDLARYLADCTEPWIRYVRSAFEMDGCPLHDPLALAVALDPSWVSVEQARVRLELGGEMLRSRMVCGDANWEPGAEVRLVTGLENRELVRRVLSSIQG